MSATITPNTSQAVQGLPSNSKATKLGQIPFMFNLTKGKDSKNVFIRVQGNDPTSGYQACYVTFDSSGNPSYNHDQTDPSKFCIPLSKLPSDILIPELDSGRVYVSIGATLKSQNPDPQNTKGSDYTTPYTFFELTNVSKNQEGVTLDSVWCNVTAVDTFSSPSVQLQMNTSFGKGPLIGYAGDPSVLLTKAQKKLGEYGGSAASTWAKLFMKNTSGEIFRVMSPKHFAKEVGTPFHSYFSEYLKNTFLPYYQTHPLYVIATVDKIAIPLSCQVSQDLLTFNFTKKNGEKVTSITTNIENSFPWLSGGSGDWMTNPDATQCDLIRDLSALMCSGMKLESIVTSWENPISKDFLGTQKDKGLFYQAQNANGAPMYNVYDRAMHESGFTGYAYDYDDMYGNDDGTQVGSWGSNPKFTISLDF